MLRPLRLMTAALLMMPATPALAEKAPDFTLRKAPQFDDEVSLSDHREQVVLVNFWATWCKPCVMHMQALRVVHDAINDTNGDGKVDDADKNEAGKLPLEIISISDDDPGNLAQVRSFVRRRLLPFTIVLGEERVSQVYNPKGFVPYTVIIDQKGNISQRIEDYAPGEECHVLDKVAALLGRTDVAKPAPCQD